MEQLVEKILEGLNMFDGTSPTPYSDQDIEMVGSHESTLSYLCIIS